ncbi:helix-turn-helix domain-containing protein [Microbacterium sp. ASV49]|uniref:Helix-turn-helix domain-containing protein n=1 Tax=Microbacterium candidum TaxID=3041922 RepID=A0ABT7N019_9MICO|nr:helix-turn-helix domain-containing protein [Microbacterium sp. ASV49]MDL9980053.1 helix-turn-helix domain-containing protein [Microbacterium sp. ASV49]
MPVNGEDHVTKAKDDFLLQSDSAAGVNLELLKSWQRSKDAIGVPANVRDVPQVAEELLDAHILDMFQAPLSRLSDDLDGTGLGLLLADSRGTILQRWSHDHTALAHLDRLGTVRGAMLAEDVVGTNGVGTVAATGKSLQISGNEHFADFYSAALCTGSPVRHPATGKLLAVVTISSEISERSGLLRPMVKSVATQLEQHLLEVERPSARRLFEEFLLASRTHGTAVLAFGPQGLVMQSRSAGRLSAADVTLIEQHVAERRATGRFTLEVSNGTVDVQATRLGDDAGVVVVLGRERSANSVAVGPARAQLVGRSPEWMSVARDVARHREVRRPLLIAGEVGVGKTSLALGLPFRARATSYAAAIADAAERHVVGNRRWLQNVAERLDASAPVVMRGVEALDRSSLDALRLLLEQRGGHGAVMLTMSTEKEEAARTLAGDLGVSMAWVPSLKERTVDIPLLWLVFAEQLAPGAGLQLRDETAALMRGYPWPRNLKELRGVVERMSIAGKRGPVLPGDLPLEMQGSRMLSMIERAELDAIRRALAEAEGNRSKAAEILGLSRATVYRKMKAYRLSA